MVWTEITRAKYCRDGLRYASDTTDEEWAMIAPYMPCKNRRGRPRVTEMRTCLLTQRAFGPLREFGNLCYRRASFRMRSQLFYILPGVLPTHDDRARNIASLGHARSVSNP
jgi:hypothetical protein